MHKKIEINKKAYWLSPLKCKTLKRMSELMLEGELASEGAQEIIESWMPFILESLRVEHPNTTEDLVEQLNLEEFNAVLTSIFAISGIKLTSNVEQEEKDRDKDDKKGTDWDWIYARLVCCTSLRYKDIDDLTLYEAESVLDHLIANPTEAEILAAVHGVKTRRIKIHQSSETEIKGQFSKLNVPYMTGLPEDMKANLNWAEDLAAKYRKATNKRPN